MRERQKKFVVTFHTTAGAMAMEKACKESGMPGRILPVPRTITAGCGMCWAAPLDARDSIEALVIARHLDVDGLYDILL
jgi:hypothetical protein